MNINIDHMTINVILQPPAPVVVQEAPQDTKRGHRTPEENKAKQLLLEIAESRQVAMQKSAERLQRKIRIAERLRGVFGEEVANSVLGGVV